MKNFFLRLFSSFILILIFLIFLFSNKYYFNFFLIFLFFISLFEIVKIKIKYIRFLIFTLLLLFIISFNNLKTHDNHLFLIFWCVLITALTDISAYILGKLFGKKKILVISPNKTYFGYLSGLIVPQISYESLNIFIQSDTYFSIKEIIIIQFLTSFFVFFGDLLFSFFKRKLNIKDYSNIIPGHGGLFDRIDGLIFSIIFFNIYFNL